MKKLLLLLLFISTHGWSQIIEETYYFQGTVTDRILEDWEDLFQETRLRLDLDSPSPQELERLLEVDRSIQLVLRLPLSSRIEFALEKLAKKGTSLVLLGNIPTESEITTLNRLSFQKFVLVLDHYPSPLNAKRLQKLTLPYSITFSASALPTYNNKPGFDLLPNSVSYLFVTNYWPFYSHMDFFNLIPNPVSLRVSDSFPSETALDYLLHTERLQKVSIQTLWEPKARHWSPLQSLSLEWIFKSRVPKESAIRAFWNSKTSGTERVLTLDLDRALTSEQRIFLNSFEIPIQILYGNSWKSFLQKD